MVKIIVKPVSLAFLMTVHKYLLAAGSIPVVGSSKNITLGLPIKASPELTFLLFPPLRF